MKITIDIPDDLLASIKLDFPISEHDRNEYNYDGGTVWAAFDLANVVVASLGQTESEGIARSKGDQ